MNFSSRSILPAPSVIRDILKIAGPLALGQLGNIAIGVTDTIMLGRLGADALGAAGLASSVYSVLLILGMGMLFPAMVLISRARGAGRSRAAPVIIRQGLWVAGMLSVPAWVILWNLADLLLLTGQLPALARMAGHYMDYFMWAMFPALTTLVFTFAFTAMGRAGITALVIWLAAGLNALLDYVLIFGKLGFPAMGMAGAGFASVIVYGAVHTIFFGVLAFHGSFRHGAAFRHAWKPKWTILRQFFRLGWPKGIEFLMIAGLFSVTSLLVGRFGVQAIASHTIAFQILTVVHAVVSMAIARAVTSRIGVSGVQRDAMGAWHTLNSGLLVFLLLALPIAIFLELFPAWAVALFIGFGPKAQDILPIAAPLMALIALFVLADGVHLIAGHALNGLADMKMPALIAGLAHWGIGLPIGVVLGFAMEFSVLGLWWGLTLGMVIAATAYLARFRWVVRRFEV